MFESFVLIRLTISSGKKCNILQKEMVFYCIALWLRSVDNTHIMHMHAHTQSVEWRTQVVAVCGRVTVQLLSNRIAGSAVNVWKQPITVGTDDRGRPSRAEREQSTYGSVVKPTREEITLLRVSRAYRSAFYWRCGRHGNTHEGKWLQCISYVMSSSHGAKGCCYLWNIRILNNDENNQMYLTISVWHRLISCSPGSPS